MFDITPEEATRLKSLSPAQRAAQRVDLLEEAERLQQFEHNGTLTKTQEARYNETLGSIAKIDQLTKHDEIREAAKDPKRTFPLAVNVNTKSAGQPWQVRDASDGDEVRGRAVDALERVGASDQSIERAIEAMVDQATRREERNELAERIAVCSDPAYARAFGKLALDPVSGHNNWTTDERAAWDRMLEARAAMAVGTGSTGGYMVPTHLDPTIILTNNGSSNIIRSLAREVTIGPANVWHGVSSDGVTASYDAEATEVSDDSPTLVQPTIPTYQAQAFIRASVQAWDDIPNLQSETLRLFTDAKDRLEETKFTVGAGSTEPTGVFTKIAATSGSRVVSASAAAIAVADLKSVYRAVPARHRRVSTWLANSLYTLAVKDLGTAVSASYSGDLRDPAASRWYDLPVAESDDAPTTQTTTALDPEILLGDFSNYVIVDRLGASAEFIPHLFGTSNGRPTGERGMYFRFRNGADVVNTNAFRLLCDKTSA